MGSITITYDKINKDDFRIPSEMKDITLITDESMLDKFSLNNYLPAVDFDKYVLMLHVSNFSEETPTPAIGNFHLEVQKVILDYFNITYKHIRERSRKHNEFVVPRQLAFYFTVEYCPRMSKTDIGLFYGRFDHATVWHGWKKISNLVEVEDKKITAHFESLNAIISQKFQLFNKQLKK